MFRALTSGERERLIQTARDIACRAYAPYSRFKVGAVVKGSRGIYSGTNVENASYGLTLCAERSALSAAIAAGDLQIEAVAVACIDASPDVLPGSLMPCGACRQWLAELAPGATILIAGLERDYAVSELLPSAFTLK